ncbi:MAG TPA: pyridoxal phosphate-dependent aminotransferase [Candidatus Angelobacter sp.]|nr:pyridoxal phosphate-dependent aminotransferase [Candidatus Angelobacter sp.]
MSTRSPYMEWAKLSAGATFNLATSGMVSLPLAELEVEMEQLEINGSNSYGYSPLLDAIAQRYRVPRECVVTATGTSFANYLALAGATEPGDEILIEEPSYDPLLNAARYLGLEIKRFSRPAGKDFSIDLSDLERNLSPRTRLIVLCSPHNPSAAVVSDAVLREIAGMARRSNACVLVDEVYREMLFEAQPESAFHLDPEHFIITSSLTKAYGLSGLRCGWLLAPKEIAQRIWRIHDVHGSTYPYPTELLSLIAFQKLPKIAARMKTLLHANRGMLRDFLASRNDLEYFWPEYGTIVFPRVKLGRMDELCAFLRDQFSTSVVPGNFFESTDRFRIGVGLETEAIRKSLSRLGEGLNAYRETLR